MSYNEIGVEGGKAVAEMMKVNTTVRTLDIGGNKIGDEGGKAMAEMLKLNTTLHTLYITYNNIGVEGGKAIAEMLNVNTTSRELAIRRDNNIGDDVSSCITTLVADNNRLWKQQKKISEIGTDAPSYYIKGYVAAHPSLTTIDDSYSTHWRWTEEAWEAVNSTDGRVTQVLLNCLKTANIKANKASLKRLAENDEKDENLLLHIAATKTHSAVLNLLKFFIDDVEVDIDCSEKSGRTIRMAAMGSDNKESAAWARTLLKKIEPQDPRFRSSGLVIALDRHGVSEYVHTDIIYINK